MVALVTVLLDDDVRETPEAEAPARHIGLSTILGQVASRPSRGRDGGAFAAGADTTSEPRSWRICHGLGRSGRVL
jgi:hypothetical protein